MKLPATLRLLIVSAAVANGPAQAFAQTPAAQRPSNGLFFEERTASQLRQRLDVTVSTNEGYDSDRNDSLEGLAAVGKNGLEPTGPSTMLSAAADYAWRGQHAQFRAAGASTLHYYRGLGDILHSSDTNASHVAAMGFSIGSRQTRLVANQTASYASSALPNLVRGSAAIAPGEAPPALANYTGSDFGIKSYITDLTLARAVGPRNSIEATAEYQHSETRSATIEHDVSVYASRLQYRRHSARNTDVTAAYMYRLGDTGYNIAAQAGRKLPEHGIEFGVNHRRALGATRHLIFFTGVGASTLQLPGLLDESGATSRRYTQLSAQLSTSYEFGRSWQLRATARRGGVEYVAGLSEPVSATSVTTSIDGLLSRRADVLMSAAHSSGESALTHDGGVFSTYTGNATLRYAMTRVWAVYVQYVYDFYDFDEHLPLMPGIPPKFERNGVRAGVMLRAPALRR